MNNTSHNPADCSLAVCNKRHFIPGFEHDGSWVDPIIVPITPREPTAAERRAAARLAASLRNVTFAGSQYA